MALVALAACEARHGPDADVRAPPTGDGAAAQRIVSLAPHLTELVYTAGAGERLVGVVAFSDYPPAARELPVIGDAFRIDLERLATLDPDLVLAWHSGNPDELIAQLHRQGYRVVVFATDSLADVADHLAVIGELAGTAHVAAAQAQRYLRELAALRREYADRIPVSVFYQISAQPLYTVGARHPIDEMISSCGGRNVFGDLDEVAPVVTVEAVLLREPDVILAAPPPGGADVFAHWRDWTRLAAVRDGHLYAVDASLVGRSSMRILDGLRQICARLEQAR